MNTSMLSSTTGATIRVCSDMRCKTPLSPKCKGNLCPECIARMRSPRLFPNGSTHAPQQNMAPSVYLPTSVPIPMGANNPAIYPSSALSQYQEMPSISSHGNDANNVQPRYHTTPRMQRSFTIPHRPNVLYVPNSSEPALGAHFNSRGELINHRQVTQSFVDFRAQPREHIRLPVGCRECGQCGTLFQANPHEDLCLKCRTPHNTHIPIYEHRVKSADLAVKQKDHIFASEGSNSQIDSEPEAGDDVLMDDLELVYPEEIVEANSMDVPSSIHPDVQGHRQQKKDAPSEKMSPHASTNLELNNNEILSTLPDTPSDISRTFLKLCSANNCTGIISVNSLATRCLQCVKRDWKMLKTVRGAEHLDLNAGHTSISGTSRNVFGTANEEVRRKGVTWADQADDRGETQFDTLETSRANPRLILKIPQIKVALGIGSLLSPSSELSPNNIVSASLPSNEPYSPTAGPSTIAARDDTLSSPKTSYSKSPEKLPRVRLLLSKPKSASSSSASTFTSAPTLHTAEVVPPSVGPTPTVVDDLSGCESDLTELSEATRTGNTSLASDSASDLSESSDSSDTQPHIKVPQPSLSAGLKIRIPARPGGIYAPKCVSPRCNNTLTLGYRWKSCVLCRARNRDYQRRRHNVQIGHMRLDHELSEAGIAFLPEGKADRSSESPALVSSARLCSVRDCCFIVPSAGEYQWKMCALCRLRRRDQKRPEKQSSELNKQSKHAEMLLKLASPTFTCAKPRKGRCQSIDCGMLLTDLNAAQCPQCTTRRLRLIKRSGHYPTVANPSRHYSDKPLNPSPYPQFKSFSAFLLEFKHRLTGFLHAQSVFFLFKESDSINAVFALDGEYSVCCLDFDILRRARQIEEESLKLKHEIEHVGRLKFSPGRQVSILDGGGIAIRFSCIYPVPILQNQEVSENQVPSQPEPTTPLLATVTKHMKCELEIANLPDHSHRFIPGQRTIIRFRLLG